MRNKSILSIIIGSISSLLLFYIMCISVTDIHHNSIQRNYLTGDIVLDTVPGVKITYPWVQVIRIDKRPYRICITSSSKNLNCGLYSINFKYIGDLIEKEGVEYYWWRNRFSFNPGHKDEYRGFIDMLKGYALDDSKKYRFINYHN